MDYDWEQRVYDVAKVIFATLLTYYFFPPLYSVFMIGTMTLLIITEDLICEHGR